MMPQNLDALVSVLSGASTSSGKAAEGLVSDEDMAAWGEALAMFEAAGGSSGELSSIPGEAAGKLPSTLIDDNAEALDWLGQLGELNALVDQALEGELPIGEELMAELQALLGVLDDALSSMNDGALLENLQGQLSDALAGVQVGVARLLESSLADEQSTQAAAMLRETMTRLQALSEKVADLDILTGPETASALQTLSALQQSLQRGGPEQGSNRAPALVHGDDGQTAAASRDAALARLAELTAAARESLDGKALGKTLPEVTRAVLLAQQFQMASAAQPSQGESSLGNSRTEGGVAALSATAGAPAREPALPPTAQLMGQPGATAGEMRAAAEQAMQRVLWMASREQGVSQARLKLHPAHLGKVDVHLEITGREASVVLNVQNGPVREAMEAMLPRLRDQLEQQGINLGDASVFDSESEDAAPDKRSENGGVLSDLGADGESETEELSVRAEMNLRGRGLLDAYA